MATIRPKHQYSELAVVEVVLNDHAKPLKLPMHAGTALCLLQALRSKDAPTMPRASVPVRTRA